MKNPSLQESIPQPPFSISVSLQIPPQPDWNAQGQLPPNYAAGQPNVNVSSLRFLLV